MSVRAKAVTLLFLTLERLEERGLFLRFLCDTTGSVFGLIHSEEQKTVVHFIKPT